MNWHRRDFMALSAAGVMGLSGRAFADPQEPDLIVHNARVHTVDDALPKAQAFAVRTVVGGKTMHQA